MQRIGRIARGEFAKRMAVLRASYSAPVRNADDWTLSVRVYWDACQGYDADAVRMAFVLAPRRHPAWFPSLGQLQALIEHGERPPALRAEEAWLGALRIAQGSRKPHEDPVAREAIRMLGGRRVLGLMTCDEIQWIRKRFVTLYADLAEQGFAHQQLAAAPRTRELEPRARALVKGIADGITMPD